MEKELDQPNEEREQLKGLSTADITEAIVKSCGNYGRYQKTLTVFFIIFLVCNGMSHMTMSFIIDDVPFGCFPPNFNDSLIPPNITVDQFLNDITAEDEKCSFYDPRIEERFYTNSTVNSTKDKCNYGRKYFTDNFSSIVSEFDLVCEREWIRNLVLPALFLGNLFGAPLCGAFSDRFGRSKVLFWGESLQTLCHFLKLNSINYLMFMILYFCDGFLHAFSFIPIYTIMVESVTQDYRLPITCLSIASYATGGTILAGVAYLIRDWRYILCVAHSSSAIVLIIAFIYLPESPRWLLGRKRFTDADKAFRKIARQNNKENQYKSYIIDQLQQDEISKATFCGENITFYPENNQKPKHKTHTIINLLNRPRRAMITIIIWFGWFVSSMLYYGLSINSVSMVGNKYLNFALVMSIEIPANLVSAFVFKCFSRRISLSTLLVFAGINCIVSNFVPKDHSWYPLVLTVLGKIGASASFCGIYLITSELFPTQVRSIGMGTSSSFGKVGGFISPLILSISTYGTWLPLTIYGTFGILAGCLVFLLPETKQVHLIQTFEDMDIL